MCGMNSQFSRSAAGTLQSLPRRLGRFCPPRCWPAPSASFPHSPDGDAVVGRCDPGRRPGRPDAGMDRVLHADAGGMRLRPVRARHDRPRSEIWKTIVDVNERVNDTILPVTDQDHWGVADRWDYPDDGLGDCEDIQLLKRRLLTEAGLPHRALRMTVVIDELGAGHAVLMAQDRSRRLHSRQQAQGRSALAADGLSLCEAGRLGQCGLGLARQPGRADRDGHEITLTAHRAAQSRAKLMRR